MEWKILSNCINKFIKGLWGRSILMNNEKLFNIFLGVYFDGNKFIDFNNNEKYFINQEEFARIRLAFDKRVKSKKEKYLKEHGLIY